MDRRAWTLAVVGIGVAVALIALLTLPLEWRSRIGRTTADPSAPVASAPPRMSVEELYAAIRAPTSGTSFAEAVTLSVEVAGDVLLPSGRLVASDAFIIDAGPFTQTMPAGRHRVSALRVDFENGDRRLAAAMVRVADGDPVRWEPALVGGQDPATLGPDEIFGYGVDSGTGSFTSPEAVERLRDPRAFEQYSAAVTAGMFPSEGTFLLTVQVLVDRDNRANVVALASGFGDGVYPSYIGFGADGDPVVVLTDFGILDATG